ncbi:MAG: hypothetical protein WDA41_09505 [Candidatus Neomarinimicrobiota bacterium]
MNEELTREVLEAIKKCKFDCTLRGANGVCSNYDWNQKLASALLAEKAKSKGDVWEYATPCLCARKDKAFYDVFENTPVWAISAVAFWASQAQSKIRTGPVFNREIPKTRARQIAENIVHGITGVTNNEARDIEYVEGVLNKYAEELKGEA